MAESLDVSYSRLKDKRIEYGLALAYEANKAFDIVKEATSTMDTAIEQHRNSETVGMYIDVRNNARWPQQKLGRPTAH